MGVHIIYIPVLWQARVCFYIVNMHHVHCARLDIDPILPVMAILKCLDVDLKVNVASTQNINRWTPHTHACASRKKYLKLYVIACVDGRALCVCVCVCACMRTE